ncbi:MAG TPA: hypothetical protein DEP66_03510 [Acidimicrobiaceae bacterium]|nr:hypothetical protein [Acidimicrobiaceae bacterium]HCB37282.1 hypothetical protein [Acidimicrobiaceae bacterium]
MTSARARPPVGRRRLRLASALAAVVLAAAVVPLGAAGAQSSSPSDADLVRERAELKAKLVRENAARKDHQSTVLGQLEQVNVARGDVTEVEDALVEVQKLLVDQRAVVAEAELAADSAAKAVKAAEQRVTELNEQKHELRQQISDLIVQNYIGRDAALEGSLGLARTGDIYEAARIQTLVGAIYGDLRAAGDQLRAVQVDAEQALRELDAAEARAVLLVEASEADEADLLEITHAQVTLLEDVEERYERRLSEAAALEAIDAQLAQEIRDSEKQLVGVVAEQQRRERARIEAERRIREQRERERLAREGAAGRPSSRNIPASQLLTVRGITVHESIFVNLSNLLDAALADGVKLGGGGYRSASQQITLRRYNCGSSEWSIYQKRASSCRPPTARPGHSMHELGLAVDFTSNGRAITSRNTAAFRWLRANAGKYGFRNLPSEPWHWSTNGN